MRVGITAWNGRVSPVLDAAGEILVVDLPGRGAGERRPLSGGTVRERADEIVGLRLDALICGAVSRPLGSLLSAAGVNLVPWVAGEVDEVLAAFEAGGLVDPSFVMPGCGRRAGRRMWRRGLRDGGGRGMGGAGRGGRGRGGAGRTPGAGRGRRRS